MRPDAAAIIAALNLTPLPDEGGFFRQTWRTEAGSAILYLMTPTGFSALHRLRTDEVWHFHAGDCAEHVQLGGPSGVVRRTYLGPDVPGGEQPQVVVPAGVWQGARLAAPAEFARGADAGTRSFGWALLGATLAPPWDPQDFELAVPAELRRAFPTEVELIAALTR